MARPKLLDIPLKYKVRGLREAEIVDTLGKKEGVFHSRMEKTLQRLFKQYMLKKYKYKCVMTGAMRNLVLSHFYPQSDCPAVKYDEYNCIIMVKSLEEAYHRGNCVFFYEHMKQTLTPQKWTELAKASRKASLTTEQILDLIRAYQGKIAELSHVKGRTNQCKK